MMQSLFGVTLFVPGPWMSAIKNVSNLKRRVPTNFIADISLLQLQAADQPCKSITKIKSGYFLERSDQVEKFQSALE